MFSIFSTEQEAQVFADTVQEYLVANRPGYNAAIWDEPTKHYDQDLWAVAMPPENVPVPEGATIQDGLEGWVSEQ